MESTNSCEKNNLEVSPNSEGPISITESKTAKKIMNAFDLLYSCTLKFDLNSDSSSINKIYKKNYEWLSKYDIKELEEMKKLKDAAKSLLPYIVILVTVMSLQFGALYNFTFSPQLDLVKMKVQPYFSEINSIASIKLDQAEKAKLAEKEKMATGIYSDYIDGVNNAIDKYFNRVYFFVLMLIAIDLLMLRRRKLLSLVIARVIQEKNGATT